MKIFENQVVLITGAGGGIGQAIVKQMAQNRAVIVASDFSEEGLQAVRNIAAKHNADVHTIQGDLTDKSHCAGLPQQAVEMAGGLDIVINNAGIITRGNILDATDEDWNRSMQVNVEAVFQICRSAIAHMQDNGGGAIVNTASCWGLYPGPDHVVYCTSKAAVAAMSKCLGRDHAHAGIRVNAVCPNEVNTPMLRTGFEKRGFDPDTAIAELGKSVPIGHVAEPEEIAEVICYLASDAARYITGTTVEVNGGKPVF
ncbi:MAG: meso-butanediol dehydrogenase/(S,S)-butanediol dehydrogenase/diacetyl reductase [Saprospiraceae bacterium]|jgi:meso-butanediol dehydrogenase/(S,S)-butanediol dehydrogenase/diacetyl reductase